MTRIDCEIAVLGSGFGGTLLAIIARKLGYSVALLERGSHPRFAIGESSTPLADFKLAAIADDFGLDWLRPFAKYGTWKAAYPHLACGLKRGFSFFRHEQGQYFTPTESNSNALLVAASPDDATADTHWFRADFDAHLVERAIKDGVPYYDQLEIQSIQHGNSGWKLEGTRPDGAVSLSAKFVVDASGNGQVLGQVLGIKPVPRSSLLARSRALYSHFNDVARWQDLLEEQNGQAATANHVFPCDAAAMHQIIDGGWMWVLRFENGITSAGFSLDPQTHPLQPNETPEAEWVRLLKLYPALAHQFAQAKPVRPFVQTGRLQRRLSRASGPDWALLPHAAGFLDAWLSPGIAQTLFAVNRLGRILAENWHDSSREQRLAEYGQTVLQELVWMDEITGTCFACFDRFPILATVTMLYFAAAIYCEERERSGQAGPNETFLLADHPGYRKIAARLFQRAVTLPESEAEDFMLEARGALEPYNFGGLCDPQRRNIYPFVCNLPSAGR